MDSKYKRCWAEWDPLIRILETVPFQVITSSSVSLREGVMEFELQEIKEMQQVKGEPHFSSLSGWEKGFEGKLTVWDLANCG